MAYWSKEETFKLISIWSEENIQAQLEGCKRNRQVYTKISHELSAAGYNRTYEQSREKLKKLKAEHRKISDKRKQTGEGRYPEWDYFDAMDTVLGHKPSTQPAVVVDTLEDSQVQDTQDDEQTQPEMGATPTNLDSSDNTVPSPTSTDVTDASGDVATTSQEQTKGSDGTAIEKATSRKRKKGKVDKAGEMMDKFIGMQEKSDKMFMELEMKRARLEEKQIEMDAQLRREEREFQLQMMNMLTRNSRGMLPPVAPSYPMHSTYGYDGYDPDATQDGL
ncbi:uncharacterized protein [Dysidea avara]|uniref:uncharacterized protein n=1 Tax=Dysidea avara TaxID=196820 RepID=UPI003327F736